MRTRRDVAGIIVGSLLAGGAAIWMLAHAGLLAMGDIGLAIATLLVVAGLLGLVSSSRN